MADRTPSRRTRSADPPPDDKTLVADSGHTKTGASQKATSSEDGTVVSSGTTPDQPALLPQVPDFELQKEVGRGGNGVVYKARQVSLDRIVAVKMLPADRADHGGALTRFLDEARAAASISHPNVVAVHQVGQCPAGHYFVMEYVQGTTLQAVLDVRGPEKPVPMLWAVEVMETISRAVHYAHGHGIYHRDLKPSNIIIERQTGRPVVLDFGIARRVDKRDPTATAVGTPGYMSPEQAGEAVGTLGTPSDVYALGAILYRMLTGRLPFVAGTPLDTLLLVAGPTAAEAVNKLRPQVPQRLNDICMRCLSKKPEERFRSCEELARDLKLFLGSSGSSNVPAAQQPKPESKEPTEPKEQKSGPAVVLQLEPGGKSVRLTKSVSLIGRSSDCDFVIKKSDVSKRHCRIYLHADGAEVEDLNSTSGTVVNGRPVTRRFLADGDHLEVAAYSFLVRLDLNRKK
jgi:serine/threonine protein kinase